MAFCVLSINRKTFAVSSLVLNLFASQIGEFFLPHPVYPFIHMFHEPKNRILLKVMDRLVCSL